MNEAATQRLARFHERKLAVLKALQHPIGTSQL